MNVPTLRTRRLVLRQYAIADAVGLLRLARQPETTRYLQGLPQDLRSHAESVRRVLAADYPDGLGSWVVTEPDSGLVIGRSHLRPSDQLPGAPAEIGWFLMPERWGLGLAREATEAVIRHGFDTVGVPEIWALVHEDNKPSFGLAQRFGFEEAGSGVHYGAVHRRLVLTPSAA
ncbi:GNAT family N-acetyltransferase [Fodinicola acaciae]|uniref:GNAT family N-acetyltransferase n=1 Tax=Fodinicola acaciae TaxID=2681555 RepID=UPI0013D41AF2|nr:GNAT family N-acetyltransferase [Fodinicola acaciae]